MEHFSTTHVDALLQNSENWKKFQKQPIAISSWKISFHSETHRCMMHWKMKQMIGDYSEPINLI